MGKFGSIPVGYVFTAKCGTTLTVSDYRHSSSVEVVDNEGNRRVVTAYEIRSGIVWKTPRGNLRRTRKVHCPPRVAAYKPVVERKNKSPYPAPQGYYVYICTVDGELSYVGMGKGVRYTHCISGRSSCKELNRAYFQKAAMMVEVYKDSLSRQEALRLERELIEQLKPRFNIR